MDQSDRDTFNRGDFLDASHFNANGELIARYNAALAKTKELGTAVIEATVKTEEQLEATK